VAEIPMPLAGPQAVIEAVQRAAGSNTRLALLDHVTSPTGVVFPIEELVRRLRLRGIDTLVDGAHAPGMVSVQLERLGAAYYAGNCHKWLCAPKGAGFLWARRDRQDDLQPAVISHGYNTRRPGRSRFHDAFDWTGTDDVTSWLCVADALRFLDGLEGGMAGQMARNRALVVQGRRLLCGRLGIAPPCPEDMLGALAALPLGPDDARIGEAVSSADASADTTPLAQLQTHLLVEHGLEVPFYHWPKPPHGWFRISAQAYNTLAQYERLAEVLAKIL
jgi:isopenicillin-N epimerase